MKKLGFVILFVLLFMFLLVSVAFAQETPNAATRTGEFVIYVLGGVASVFGGWLLHRLIAVFEKKTGIEISDANEAKLDALLDRGLDYGEEQGSKLWKRVGKKLTMPEKLEKGSGYVLDRLDAAHAKEWTRAKIESELEARLYAREAAKGKREDVPNGEVEKTGTAPTGEDQG